MTYTTSVLCEHTRVDSVLALRMFDQLCTGRSAVILGHRNNGKHILIRDLKKHLQKAQFAVETMQCAKLAAKNWSAEVVFRSFCDKHGSAKKWVLIVSDIDSLPAGETRYLLEEIRTRADRRELVAIVTGQLDLRDRIQGPKSELTAFDHYLAQGLSEAASAEFAAEFLKDLCLPPDPQHPAQKEIWHFAGGNTFLMRAILWATIERRTRTGNDESLRRCATADEIRESVDAYSFDASEYLVANAARLIASDPECWQRFETLIRTGQVAVAPDVKMGGALTLSGVAVREGDRLRWSSELMRRLITRRFTPLSKIADLYARSGKWDMAFPKYRELIGSPQVRPYNRDDSPDVVANVDALAASLSTEAAKGIDALRRRFLEGCRWVLGVREVHFWSHREGWLRIDDADVVLSAKAKDASESSLPPDPHQEKSVPLELPYPWRYWAVGAILSGVRPDQCDAVLAGDFREQESLTRERRALLETLLQYFLKAHDHAVGGERARRRLETRDQHTHIVTSILDAMGTDFRNAGQVIERAAQDLCGLGYARVTFHLVDSDRKNARLACSAGKSAPDAQREISLATSDSVGRSLHAHVVLSGKAVRHEGFAIVPIRKFTVDEKMVLGTIQVVRSDLLTPSAEEVNDLELFAKQLSTAIRYAERVQLMQSTLDDMPAPVVIFDAQSRLRYVNDAGGRLFGVSAQWREPAQVPIEIDEDVRGALAHGTHFRHVESLGKQDYKGDVNSKRIVDWRSDCAGGFVTLNDFNGFAKVAKAWSVAAQATNEATAIDNLLDAVTKGLDHPWVRIYFVDPLNASVLRSERGRGFPHVEQFNRHDTLLEKGRSAGERGWKCILDSQPLLFEYAPDPQGKDMVLDHTPLGIPFFRVSQNEDDPIIRKEPGDFWLDFPLITPDGTVLGKVTLGCDKTLSREEYDGFFVLSSWLAAVISVFRQLDRLGKQKQEWVEEAANLSMAMMAHSMNARFAALAAIASKYDSEETALVAMKAELKEFYESFFQIVAQAKRDFSVVRPKWVLCDLVQVASDACRRYLSDEQWYGEGLDQPCSIHADPILLDAVFAELLGNAKKMKVLGGASDANLRVRLSISERESAVVIVVEDNGPGVPEEFRPKIFKAFERLFTGTKPEGQGLGLFHVARIIAAHGGAIEVEGDPGSGARFVITLPRVHQQSAANREDISA